MSVTDKLQQTKKVYKISTIEIQDHNDAPAQSINAVSGYRRKSEMHKNDIQDGSSNDHPTRRLFRTSALVSLHFQVIDFILS